MASQIRFDDRVAIITGAGGGLGRVYALELAKRGAKVVVNDLGGSFKGEGASASLADKVVEEIRAAGGTAVANYDSVTNGDAIVKTAMDNFGRIDILINNAGILRDVSMQKMTDKDWDSIMEVHLKGAFSCARACWPIMRNQKFGRILNTSSGSGIYGNFGQTNYSAAKIGLHGFTQTLAKEGEKYNIRTNSIAPAAYSRMTATIWPEEFKKYFSAEKIVPVALYLVTEQCEDNGSLIETVGGGICRHRIQRAEGAFFRGEFGPEDVAGSWGAVTNFDGTCDYPNSNTGIFERVMGLLEPKL